MLTNTEKEITRWENNHEQQQIHGFTVYARYPNIKEHKRNENTERHHTTEPFSMPVNGLRKDSTSNARTDSLLIFATKEIFIRGVPPMQK